MTKIDLVWFDIDHTLALFPKRQTEDEAFAAMGLEVFNQPNLVPKAHQSQGKTEMHVVRELLESHHIDFAPSDITRACMVLGKHTTTALKREFPLVLPGVKELLQKLQTDNIPLGLVTTGSIWQAEAKLRAVHLWNFFNTDLSSFGHETEDSGGLLQLALLKCRHQFNAPPQNCWYICADPVNILRGRLLQNVQILAVGTGNYHSPQEMQKKLELQPSYRAHAFHFLANLNSADLVLKLMQSSRLA